MAVFYVAVIEAADSPGHGVFFPDVPGCTSAGDTIQDAAQNAAEALALYFEETDDRPAARAPDEIAVDEDVREVARVLIAAPEADGPIRRYNVTLPSGLVKRIDRRVGPRRRSAFLASATRRALESR